MTALSDTRSDTKGFRCPFCGTVSHNPNDARERYCGNCHRFVDDNPMLSLDRLYAEISAEMEAVAGISEAQLTGVSDTKSDTNPISTIRKTGTSN